MYTWFHPQFISKAFCKTCVLLITILGTSPGCCAYELSHDHVLTMILPLLSPGTRFAYLIMTVSSTNFVLPAFDCISAIIEFTTSLLLNDPDCEAQVSQPILRALESSMTSSIEYRTTETRGNLNNTTSWWLLYTQSIDKGMFHHLTIVGNCYLKTAKSGDGSQHTCSYGCTHVWMTSLRVNYAQSSL